MYERYAFKRSAHPTKTYLSASENMAPKSTTLLVSNFEISPLKLVLYSNMERINVTDDVFQVEISPLKANADLNILRISVTLCVCQADKSWLNIDASRNIESNVVTCATFQLFIGASNDPAP